MMNYKSYCSATDGLPPLWPFPPLWPTNAEIRTNFGALMRVPLQTVDFLCGDQRSADMHWNHSCFLLDALNDGSDATRSAAEWVALVAAPAGYDTSYILRHLGATTQLSHAQFSKSMVDCLSMLKRSSDPYTPCADLVRKCDTCKVSCTSECMCGEAYCSRECMRKDWACHRATCMLIYDNNTMGWALTQFEMHGRLSKAQFDAALRGGSVSAMSDTQGGLRKVAAAACSNCNNSDKKMKICGKCRLVSYCSPECQKADWKQHKSSCGINHRMHDIHMY